MRGNITIEMYLRLHHRIAIISQIAQIAPITPITVPFRVNGRRRSVSLFDVSGPGQRATREPRTPPQRLMTHDWTVCQGGNRLTLRTIDSIRDDWRRKTFENRIPNVQVPVLVPGKTTTYWPFFVKMSRNPIISRPRREKLYLFRDRVITKRIKLNGLTYLVRIRVESQRMFTGSRFERSSLLAE